MLHKDGILFYKSPSDKPNGSNIKYEKFDFRSGDVIGIYVDLDSGSIEFEINGKQKSGPFQCDDIKLGTWYLTAYLPWEDELAEIMHPDGDLN